MPAILIVFLSGRGKSLLLLVVRVFTFVPSDTLWYGGITHSLGISSLGTSFFLEVHLEFLLDEGPSSCAVHG